MSLNHIPLYLSLVLLSLGSSVSAHATLVLGSFKVSPATPQTGQNLTLELDLKDPTQVPVEDAYVFVELRPEGREDAEPLRAEFSETNPGVYTSTVTLPQPGAYQVRLRDQTYRQEEAVATLEAPLRTSGSNPAQDFVFPPTATGPASLRAWLLWLIGLPVVAAVVVTVLVLTRSKDAEKKDTERDEQNGKQHA